MRITQQGFGMGWLPDCPDFRDYTEEHKSVRAVLTPLRARKSGGKIPVSVDLREWCSPIKNQGALGSCTAHAGVGLVEYYEKRALGKHIDASRLFLYKVTRNLLHSAGDAGAFLRSTMGSLVLFGVPPEEYWPYEIRDFDKEPPAFCYAFAQSYQTIQYYRHDPPATPKTVLLARIKSSLAAGHPSMLALPYTPPLVRPIELVRYHIPVKAKKLKAATPSSPSGMMTGLRSRTSANTVQRQRVLFLSGTPGVPTGETVGMGGCPMNMCSKGLPRTSGQSSRRSG